MQVFRHVNSIYQSNTYLLFEIGHNKAYLVDPGSDCFSVISWLHANKVELGSIFLTHAHHDHIYGINYILSLFPRASLYIMNKSIKYLFSAKANMSEYVGRPFVLKPQYQENIKFVFDRDTVKLWDNASAYILFTPGHTDDSMTFQVGNYILSGDSLIPGMKTFCRKRVGGDPISSANSIRRIFFEFANSYILLPGHGKEYTLAESQVVNKYYPLNSESGFCEI